MAQSARMVVDHFSRIVKPDGGELELMEVSDGVMRLRYRPGHNEECESCVLSAEDLKELITEAVRQHDAGIVSVELLLDHSPSH